MSVRKGVEDIVALSQRLDDLHGRLSIDCVGGASLFSDYRVLLEDLNPRIARYFGSVDSKELPALYRACHGLLQPSRYEPFGNAVGEALASGLPVVVTDQVGAGEDISADACRKYIAGDVGALERLVRELVLQLEGGEGAALSRVARAEAIRRFDRSIIAASVTEALRAGTA
jgi:glycosyltransferase involved in cell wall biosynthesis